MRDIKANNYLSDVEFKREQREQRMKGKQLRNSRKTTRHIDNSRLNGGVNGGDVKREGWDD